MDRRRFIEAGATALLAGAVALLVGCGTADPAPETLGNQDRLWNIAAGTAKTEQPIELSYAKDTPAFFRDESMGRADPSFVPATGSG